jgi:hypothetical protein
MMPGGKEIIPILGDEDIIHDSKGIQRTIDEALGALDNTME